MRLVVFTINLMIHSKKCFVSYYNNFELWIFRGPSSQGRKASTRGYTGSVDLRIETAAWPFGALQAIEPRGKERGYWDDWSWLSRKQSFAAHNSDKEYAWGPWNLLGMLLVFHFPKEEINGKLQQPNRDKTTKNWKMKVWVTPLSKEPQSVELHSNRKKEFTNTSYGLRMSYRLDFLQKAAQIFMFALYTPISLYSLPFPCVVAG